jgi:hypothetical protein
MSYEKTMEFVKKKCLNKGSWCNGKHIPVMKKTTKKGVNGYTLFTDEDLNKAKDKEPCVYFQDNRCTHPDNPRCR